MWLRAVMLRPLAPRLKIMLTCGLHMLCSWSENIHVNYACHLVRIYWLPLLRNGLGSKIVSIKRVGNGT